MHENHIIETAARRAFIQPIMRSSLRGARIDEFDHASRAAGPASAYLGESVQPSDEPIDALLLDEKSFSMLRSGCSHSFATLLPRSECDHRVRLLASP